jgi:hypothetical protein
MIIRWRMRWARHAVHVREIINVYDILARKPEGKRPLGRSRYGWKDNIKVDLKGNRIGVCGLDSHSSG